MKSVLLKAHTCRCCSADGIFMERHVDGERLLLSLLCPKCGFSISKRAGLYDQAEQVEDAQMISHIFDRESKPARKTP